MNGRFKGFHGIAHLVLTMGVMLYVCGCGDDEAAPPPSAELAGLVTSEGTLSPAFSSGTNFYTVDVASGVTSLTVTPTASDAGATIEVNGVAVPSGAESGAISLDPGINSIIIMVTATDGITEDVYAISVTRAASGAKPSSSDQ